jgi:hypothetical protein
MALLAPAAPALAQDLEIFGWSPFTIHRYGEDVNRPAVSPDRPYWHGDDAVPLGLRWHDTSVEHAQLPVQGPYVGAPAPPRYRQHHRRRDQAAPPVPGPDFDQPN